LFSPGSRYYHHAVEHGYRYHLLEMLSIAQGMTKTKNWGHLDMEVIVLTIIYHDIDKNGYYTSNGDGTYSYTGREKFVDHLTGSFAIFKEDAKKCDLDPELSLQVEHALLAHHGRKEWGSPKEPETQEAWLVHLLDMISSRCTYFRGK